MRALRSVRSGARRPRHPPGAGEPQGHLSLWPSWRETPGGWMPRSGPAPHEACTRLVEESRG
ncbi:MbtH family NRPS accessory protein [Streptomyces decoyicus]|uniref:MbtH family NRPS accessory protein n=1 Tax=Streptomyces decoyicus TaxID=249567 RepID=UPI00398D59EB